MGSASAPSPPSSSWTRCAAWGPCCAGTCAGTPRCPAWRGAILGVQVLLLRACALALTSRPPLPSLSTCRSSRGSTGAALASASCTTTYARSTRPSAPAWRWRWGGRKRGRAALAGHAGSRPAAPPPSSVPAAAAARLMLHWADASSALPHPCVPQSKAVYRLEGIERPAPLDPRAAQPAVEELAGRLEAAAAGETREKLEAFLEETQRVGVDLEGSLGALRQRLAGCGDAAALCSFMLDLEEVYCHAGEGLPRGACPPAPRVPPAQPCAAMLRRQRRPCPACLVLVHTAAWPPGAVPCRPCPAPSLHAPALPPCCRRRRAHHGGAAGRGASAGGRQGRGAG